MLDRVSNQLVNKVEHLAAEDKCFLSTVDGDKNIARRKVSARNMTPNE